MHTLSPIFHLALLTYSSLHCAHAALGAVSIDELLLSPEHPQYIAAASKSVPRKHSPYTPWSHKPYCPSPSSSDDNYCVFTSNTTGANGVSLITISKTALEASDYLDEDPLSHFLTQKQAEYLYYNPPPYSVEEIEGKGMGIVAKRLIKKYETFMIDQAAVAMELDIEKKVREAEVLEMLRIGVKRLRRPEAVRALSDKHGEDENGEKKDREGKGKSVNREQLGKILDHIMTTNAFGTTIAGREFRGLFPLVSRINHACNPNSFVLFSQAGISIAIKAYRDIQLGEEISLSYLLLGLPSAERESNLKRWGFKCTCSLCSLPPKEKALSDSRRISIAEAEPKIQALLKEGKPNGAIRAAEEVLQHMKDENLTSMLTDQYANLARLNLHAQDKEKAEEYANLALELLGNLGFLGTDYEDQWDMEKLLAVLGERGIYAH